MYMFMLLFISLKKSLFISLKKSFPICEITFTRQDTHDSSTSYVHLRLALPRHGPGPALGSAAVPPLHSQSPRRAPERSHRAGVCYRSVTKTLNGLGVNDNLTPIFLTAFSFAFSCLSSLHVSIELSRDATARIHLLAWKK